MYLLDDVPAMRLVLRTVLELDGIEVVGEAGDGAEAVKMVTELQPNALVLDLAMPVMDGFQAIPEVRRNAPETKIIVLSGFDRATMSERALDRIVGDDWGWEHVEEGEQNAPSHVRAALTATSVVVPVRDGELALGTWQGIFFCEFDGPRRRTVYVTPLR